MGKNGRILFDRPKPIAGSSANGRRRRRMDGYVNTAARLFYFIKNGLQIKQNYVKKSIKYQKMKKLKNV